MGMHQTFTPEPSAAPYALTAAAYFSPPFSVPKKPIRARTFSPLPTRMMPEDDSFAMSSALPSPSA